MIEKRAAARANPTRTKTLALALAVACTIALPIPARAAPDHAYKVAAGKQRATLHEVLRRVKRSSIRVKRNGRKSRRMRRRRPIVQIDLDLTAMVPRERALSALKSAFKEAGLDIDPAKLPVLPSYSAKAFRNFLRETGLSEKYRGVNWDKVHESYNDHFWDQSYAKDSLTPGLAKFVADVEKAGGRVVFNTLRRSTNRSETKHILKKERLDQVPLYMLGRFAREKASAKRRVTERHLNKLGPTVAIIDDHASNRASVMDAKRPHDATEPLQVRVIVPGFTSEESAAQVNQTKHAISTFER